MKVSLNWVKQFTDIDVPTDELVKLATERLGGIEGVVDLGKHYDGIVVAKVVSCEKHPNADKLNLCKIDDGGAVKDVARDENGHVQVVCGAPNVREGLLVAWIPPGSIMPSSYGEKELFVLEARDLRGEASNGMIASPRELGINEDHDGILEIEEAVKPGTPFKELYDLDDTILEIENKMFTHRPDGFGQLGVAREIAGIQHKAFTSPDWYIKGNSLTGRRSEGVRGLGVTITDGDLCPRYMAVVLDSVQIKPSPIWLQSYLKRVGVRPINNVVDITNYMMLLTAQPQHAFDFDKVAKDGRVDITVRRPKPGEKMTLLDGKEIEPHKDAVLICNPDGPIALGGVMGGGNSEIDEKTTRVVLECATFDMYNIRKTSMIHGIFTDAVTRFTKGQPAAQLPPVLYKTVQMLEELAGAKVAGNVVDAQAPTNESRPTNHDYIEIEPKFINDRLGSKFTSEEIVKLLTNVEIQAHEASGPISVMPPFWRTDLEIPEDIVEEVGRLYGFNQLPVELPKRSIAPVAPEPMRTLKSEIRNTLARSGAHEVLTYSFVHGNILKKAGQDPEKAFALRNALSPDLQYYRLSLLPSLLDKVHANIKASYDEFTLFEIGKTHSKPVNEQTGLPDEYNYLEMVYVSSKPKSGAAYYQMLKQADNLLSQLGVPYRLEKPDQAVIENPAKKIQAEAPFNLSRAAYMYYKHAEQGGMIGLVGELEESVIKSFKLPAYTAAAIFALDGASFEVENRHLNNYKPLSRFPSTEQDLTLKVAYDVPFAALETVLKTELAKSDYDWQLQPLSIFQPSSRHPSLRPRVSSEPVSESPGSGKQIPDQARNDTARTKNISFRIILTHHERTLTTEETNKLVEQLSWQAHEQLDAEQV